MSLFYAIRRRWREARVEKLERYIQRYRKRRARLDRKQLEATNQYEALRALLANKPEKAAALIEAGGLKASIHN